MTHCHCLLLHIILLLSLVTVTKSLPPDDIYQKVLDGLQFEDPRVPRAENLKKETSNEEERCSPGIDVNVLANKQELLRECTAKLQLAEAEKSNCLEKQRATGTALFKQLVRKISEVLHPTNHDPNVLGAKILLKKDQLIELQSILQKESKAKDALDFLFQSDAFQMLEEEPSVWREWLIRLNLPLIILSCSALPSSLLFLKLLKRLFIHEFHWKRNLIFIIFIGFLCSIPWEWYRMYRVAFSKKTSELLKDIPVECNPNKDISMLQSISLFLSHKFTFADNECAKYHEHLLVDPVWEVSPLNAISVCLSRFVFEPMKLCSETLGVSFKLFFKEIPVQWQPFLFIGGFFLLSLLIMSCFGLRIETPFLKINANPHREIKYVQQPQPVQYIAQGEIQQPLLMSAQLSSIQQAIRNDGVPSQKAVVAEEDQILKKTGVMEVASEPPSPQLLICSDKSQAASIQNEQVSTNLHGKHLNQKTCNMVENSRPPCNDSTTLKQGDQIGNAEGKKAIYPSESEHHSIGVTSAVEEIKGVQTAQCEEDIPSPTFLTNNGLTADSISTSAQESVTLRRVSIEETPSSVLVPDGSSVFSMPLSNGPSSGILRQRLPHGNGASMKPAESSNMSHVENISSGSS